MCIVKIVGGKIIVRCNGGRKGRGREGKGGREGIGCTGDAKTRVGYFITKKAAFRRFGIIARSETIFDRVGEGRGGGKKKTKEEEDDGGGGGRYASPRQRGTNATCQA